MSGNFISIHEKEGWSIYCLKVHFYLQYNSSYNVILFTTDILDLHVLLV